MTNKISRRDALRGLLGGSAAVAAAVVLPSKKLWQVGAQLKQASMADIANYSEGMRYNPGAPLSIDVETVMDSGLAPIEGQPGLYMDRATGLVNRRGFSERDKYETINFNVQDRAAARDQCPQRWRTTFVNKEGKPVSEPGSYVARPKGFIQDELVLEVGDPVDPDAKPITFNPPEPWRPPTPDLNQRAAYFAYLRGVMLRTVL